MKELVSGFQTHVASLLEKKLQATGMADVTSVVISKLAVVIGVSEPTLRDWMRSCVGSEHYLHSITRETAGKFMQYFELTDLNDLIEYIPEEDAHPKYQETANAALAVA